MKIIDIDKRIIKWTGEAFTPFARVTIFAIFFYFGILKLIDQSPASPLAMELVAQTIGAQYFDLSFKILAVFECLIGVLFLLPRATRIVVPLLVVHILIVSSPLLLLPDLVWIQPFVPTLEGQYIIKNVLLVALAIGVAAQTKQLPR